MTDLQQAREALHSIPPDLPREDWVRAGMAAHAAGLDFEDFDAWSSAGSTYDARSARDVWRSFKPGGGIGVGTLYDMAKRHGHVQRLAGDRIRHLQPGSPQRQGVSPAEAWARFHPASAEHPYIAAKQGIPDGLRVVPDGDSLRIAGESMVGALAVPLLLDGSIQTLQLITAPETAARLKASGKPGKLNLPGLPLRGWFTVGELTPRGTIYLCEGIGQAWACWKATGRPAVVCFGWGRVRSVAKELRARDFASTLVLVPDAGKEQEAEAIAEEVNAQWVRMPPGWPQNSDVNDLAQRDGFDTLEALLAAPSRPPVAEPPRPPFKLVPIADLRHVDPAAPEYAWEGLVPIGHVTGISAHGGGAKSTLSLMLCVATVMGIPLFGIPTRRGRAVFFSGEDGEGLLRHRLKFICGAMNVDVAALEDKLHILDATDGDPTLFAEVTTAGRKEGATTSTYEALRTFLLDVEDLALVVVDNASDTFDASEIDRARVRGYMRALARIARERNAGVILLAHVDKGTSRGDRTGTEAYSGSTAWHNSARSRIYIRRESDGEIVLQHQKHNLGKLHEDIRLVWPEGGVPQLDQAFGSVVQGLADRNHEKALLRLLAEYSARGEHVSTAEQGRSCLTSKFANEPNYPAKLKAAEVFHILRQAERTGRVTRTTVRTENRKTREVWQVTPEGRAFAGIPASAPNAPNAPNPGSAQ